MFPIDSQILVVDDSTVLLQMLSKELIKMGFKNVDRADSPQTALNKLTERMSQGSTYDLVITDLNMKGTDGIGILNFIRKTTSFPDIPILLCTSESERNSIIQAISVGFDGYIMKPFSSDSIAKALEQTYERYQKKISQKTKGEGGAA